MLRLPAMRPTLKRRYHASNHYAILPTHEPLSRNPRASLLRLMGMWTLHFLPPLLLLLSAHGALIAVIAAKKTR